MKRATLLLILAITILINSCSSCKKQDNPTPDNLYGLPNASQTGANFLACRINGKNFIAYYDFIHTRAQLFSDTIRISATMGSSNIVYESLVFDIKSPVENIEYANSVFRYMSDSSCQGYQSPSLYLFGINAKIRITKYDKTLKIISGNFSSKIAVPNCDTLNITDGRFDFNYY